MTNEQKRNAIELNYINGNLSDSKQMFKKLPIQERKDFAVDSMYLTFTMGNDTSYVKSQYSFAKFLIENI